MRWFGKAGGHTSLHVEGVSLHGDLPLVPLELVRDACLDAAGHAGGDAIVEDGKGDAVFGDSGGVPVAVAPSVGTRVKGVGPIVLLGVVCHAVDGEGGVANAVGVAAGHGTVVAVVGVDGVVAGLVVAEDDVTVPAPLVLDDKVGDGRGVRNELQSISIRFLTKSYEASEHTLAVMPGAVKVYLPSGPGGGTLEADAPAAERARRRPARNFMVTIGKECIDEGWRARARTPSSSGGSPLLYSPSPR